MPRNNINIWLGYSCAILICIAIARQPCHAFQIEIKNDKISVQASQVPIQDLLKQLAADYRIVIRMDPAINPPVTAAFKDRNLEDGLKSILKPLNHVLFWKPNPMARQHSSVPAYLLDEIHIFRPGEKGRMVELKAPPKALPEEPGLPPTEVIIKGNKVLVPVTLSYQDRQVETTLLFDTGAGSIVLHQNVAEQLGIEDYQESQGRGVGGLTIHTKTARLDYVEVGPHKKRDLRVDIVEFEGDAGQEYNGLLGMNFIRGLKYAIDFNDHVIRWTP